MLQKTTSHRHIYTNSFGIIQISTKSFILKGTFLENLLIWVALYHWKHMTKWHYYPLSPLCTWTADRDTHMIHNVVDSVSIHKPNSKLYNFLKRVHEKYWLSTLIAWMSKLTQIPKFESAKMMWKGFLTNPRTPHP